MGNFYFSSDLFILRVSKNSIMCFRGSLFLWWLNPPVKVLPDHVFPSRCDVRTHGGCFNPLPGMARSLSLLFFCGCKTPRPRKLMKESVYLSFQFHRAKSTSAPEAPQAAGTAAWPRSWALTYSNLSMKQRGWIENSMKLNSLKAWPQCSAPASKPVCLTSANSTTNSSFWFSGGACLIQSTTHLEITPCWATLSIRLNALPQGLRLSSSIF